MISLIYSFPSFWVFFTGENRGNEIFISLLSPLPLVKESILRAHLFRLRPSRSQMQKLNFRRSYRRHENKLFLCQLRRQIPAPHYHHKLWFPGDLLRADNEFTRQRFVPVLDPDLPVDLRAAKREMRRFDPANNARADHEAGRGLLQQQFSAVLVQKVCGGRDHIELLPGEVEHLFKRRWRGRSRVQVLLRIEERQCLAVVKKFLISNVTLAMGAQLVRTRHRDGSERVQLQLLPRCQYDFEGSVRLYRKLLAGRKVVAHAPQQLFGLGIDAGRLSVTCLGPSGEV